ncbi:MAG: hypothetical protein Q9219_001982 [cf. Caloplaca sp. 3 TL-2023]
MKSSSLEKGVKRARTEDSLTTALSASPPAAASSFRNVSACNRCRLRKNRCDQNLPACSSCQKAGVKCVGFDPVTKRETPRTYVYYLENRVNYLESLLEDNGVQFAPSQIFDLGAKSPSEHVQTQSPSDPPATQSLEAAGRAKAGPDAFGQSQDPGGREQEVERKLNRLVSNIGMVSVQGTSDPRYLGSTSGISFASSVPTASSKPTPRRPSKPAPSANRASVRDSFFGLQSKPTIEPASFPDADLGLRLVNLYFEHANPQIPILHREEFIALFHRAYASQDRQRSARELYMLNIVFAIGAGIILEDSRSLQSSGSSYTEPVWLDAGSPDSRHRSSSTKQCQPEEYHASAMMHLESFLGSMPAADEPDGFGDGLEELQAVLLLAGFALLRPVSPGLWYISGVATRLGVDLGLHHEDGTDLDESGTLDRRQGQGSSRGLPHELADVSAHAVDSKEKGRREWLRDFRRRLWWCVYSFDRLVSTCVGRPFGITDQVVTTDFPTVLDDKDITPSGFAIQADSFDGPSYKRVSHHYFRLRLLQSEILQVLQYRQAQEVHRSSSKERNRYMHTKLSSSFLQPFESFEAWRQDVDSRLWDWKESAPQQEETTVQFSVQFLELNYWQAILMLYRQSLGDLPRRAGLSSPCDELGSSSSVDMNDTEDEDVYLKVAEAGQKVLMLYRQLHRIHLVNYTYLATVHLFLAGIAFLYVLWHSPVVRSRLTLDDVDFTILAATSVLDDLIDKCPPAEACRDAFERMSRATIKLCLSTTGFGSQTTGFRARDDHDGQRSFPETEGPWPRLKQQHFQLNDMAKDEARQSQGFLNKMNYTPSQATSEPIETFQTQSHRAPNDGSISEQDSESFVSMQTTAPPGAAADDAYGFSYETHNPSFDELEALLASNGTAFYDNQFGMNLGFGQEHDWSDGVQLDLFNGFFFGGVNNGGPL